MVKPLSIEHLQADPIVAARAKADGDVITVTGFVRTVSDTTISLAKHRASQSFVEYPREAIAAVFEEEDDSGMVTLLVHRDAEVQVVRPTRAGVAYLAPGGLGHGASCQSDDESETCSCLPGQKCVKGVTFCKCEDASEAVFPGAAIAEAPPRVLGEFATRAQDVDESALRAALGPGQLQPDGSVIYKSRCTWKPAWVCDSRGCRIIWYKECIYYPE